MNWEAISTIAELAGAAGVIISLVYVGAQVRASTLASQVENKLRTTDLLVQFQNMLLDKPELNALMMRGRKGIEGLSKDEYLQFANLALKSFWYFSASYYQYRKRLIEEDDWFEVKAVMEYWLSAKGTWQWWRKFGHLSFTGAFAAFVGSEFNRFGHGPDA